MANQKNNPKPKPYSVRIDLDYVAGEKLDKFRRSTAGVVSRRAAVTKIVYDALGMTK